MEESSNSDIEKSKDMFNALSFERKLVELIEELRLRRNLEAENDNTLKSIMDEKYKEALIWDEQQRMHIRQNDDLERQIELLKRKLEDKVCTSDDDKAKQHVINKTYSHEIRMLKEELRTSKSEKLNLQKKIKELEGKLNLHNNFQDSIVSQITEVRKTIKSILEENHKLTLIQKNVMENVLSAKSSFQKYDLCNQHLMQSLKIVGSRSEALKKELISARSELILLKQTISTEEKKSKNEDETEKMQKKILDLENLLLLSRQENEKTLSNFVQSNELLCKFMDKYSENQEREIQLVKNVDLLQEKLDKTERKFQETMDEMNEKLTNKKSIETQTEVSVDEFSVTNVLDVVSGPVEEVKNKLMSFQENSTTSIFGDKKVTISEVLKRKIEVLELGNDNILKLISNKKRFVDDSFKAVGRVSVENTSSTPLSIWCEPKIAIDNGKMPYVPLTCISELEQEENETND